MNKEVYEEWSSNASIPERDANDALRKVLDPKDVRGVKNRYIDLYLKYYLLEYLEPSLDDVVLEIGCGVGRLTEYIAGFVRSVYGTDLIAKFISDCRNNPNKRTNAFYCHVDDMNGLKNIKFNKFYVSSVLMYILDDTELLDTLKKYRSLMSGLERGVAMEQLKSRSELSYRDGREYCRYRTIEDYMRIFGEAGFVVKDYFILGERHYGRIYRLIHFTCNLLPRSLTRYAEKMFFFDKRQMEKMTDKHCLLNERRPTDVAFILELA